MAEQPKFSESASPTGVLDAQQQYWDAWMSMLRHSMEQTGEAAGRTISTTWSDAFKHWWEAVAPTYAKADVNRLDKLVPQGQTFLVFGEQMIKILQTLQDALKGEDNWQKIFDQSFNDLRDSLFQPFQGQHETRPGLAAFWGLPLDTWQRITSSLSIFPGDVLQAMREKSYQPTDFTGNLEKALETPALGYSREWQEQLQQGSRLWLSYQKAYWKYAQLLQRSAKRSLDLLQEKLVKMAQEGQAVDSLRTLFKLWVDCGEEAYGEVMRSAEYGETYGQMINALMRFKQHGQMMVNETLSAFKIPNRMELDTAHARLQETRRALCRLEEKAGFADANATERLFNRLQEEIRILREEVQTLKNAKATTARKRRTATAKKTDAKTRGD
jgi:class III poly(R)-hydroxyalkanoic acid synthase PhaE subunit